MTVVIMNNLRYADSIGVTFKVYNNNEEKLNKTLESK